jgi:hypothetical protein
MYASTDVTSAAHVASPAHDQAGWLVLLQDQLGDCFAPRERLAPGEVGWHIYGDWAACRSGSMAKQRCSFSTALTA